MALTLVDYWAQCPPTHLMLRDIGKALGLQVAGASKPELSEAEKWAEAGFVPGGGKVETVEFSKVPITVREFIVTTMRAQGEKHA